MRLAYHSRLEVGNYVIVMITVLSIFRRIKNVINQFEVNMDVELQQRGVEFGSLFNKHDSMR